MPRDDTPVAPPGKQSAERIVSAGSCTTNALWLLSETLDQAFGVESVLATSLHSYTSDQNLLDGKHAVEKRRGRAAALNIIPVETMAAANLKRLDSTWQNRAGAQGIRFSRTSPAASHSDRRRGVKCRPAVFALKTATEKEAANAALRERSCQFAANLLSVCDEPKVSGDMIGNPCSAVVAADLTQAVDRLLSVSAWHDNEWGYAARMIDLARSI